MAHRTQYPIPALPFQVNHPTPLFIFASSILTSHPIRFFGILVLQHVAYSDSTLRPILESLPGGLDDFELSRGWMLGWIRDMQMIHPVARWGWKLLKLIYKDHPLVRSDRP
jgi:hypothetical protein